MGNGRTTEIGATVVHQRDGRRRRSAPGLTSAALLASGRCAGSHLFFPAKRFPLAHAVGSGHPADGRPVFAYPWEGVTIVGTTDVDDTGDQAAEPRISASETAYLTAWLSDTFPSLALSARTPWPRWPAFVP